MPPEREIPALAGHPDRARGRRDGRLDRRDAGARRRASRGPPASTPTSGTTSRPRWRCWSAGEVEAARARLRLVPGHPARRRLLADEARRRRGRGRQRRDEHVGLPRGRRLAPLAGPPRRGVRRGRLAGRPARRWTSWSPCSCRSAGSPGRRSTSTAARQVNEEALLAGSVEHLPGAAGRGRARGADGRAAAGVGARRRPARPRAARAPRPVPRQVRRSRWTGTTRCSAARSAATPARALLDSRWDDFVVPGLGIRCVDTNPWVTGAETCELVLALDAVGDRDRALQLLARHAAPARRGRRLLDRLRLPRGRRTGRSSTRRTPRRR